MESAMPMTPATSDPQHLQALARANRVRLARASLKRSVAGGQMPAAEVVRRCPWEAETMTVGELLRSQQRWGLTRSRKFLSELELNENRPLGRLTERQRNVVARELELRSRARRGVGSPEVELQAA
ncbi:hypothetical protein HJD18_04365 [Thermoleophilia bacterium SCSIO 60948]|nr:hypothetical protein HJD18_04365 [Thermoleophilia bacterium SCSIO 60948]